MPWGVTHGVHAWAGLECIASQCRGVHNADPSPAVSAIIGGKGWNELELEEQADVSAAVPLVEKVQRNGDPLDTYLHAFCTGTLISNDTVLTGEPTLAPTCPLDRLSMQQARTEGGRPTRSASARAAHRSRALPGRYCQEGGRRGGHLRAHYVRQQQRGG